MIEIERVVDLAFAMVAIVLRHGDKMQHPERVVGRRRDERRRLAARSPHAQSAPSTRTDLRTRVRTMTGGHGALALACIVAAGIAPAGCFSLTGTKETNETTAIGPAPLRRLSNSEYLNALQDLFPGQAPTLPELPADIPVAGFENAAEAQQASDVRIARYETIAYAYATAVTADDTAVHAISECADWSTPSQSTACAAQFIDHTGLRIFRRPLDDGERDRFATKFAAWQSAVDFQGAVRLTLSAMLQSPQFLYRVEPIPADQAAGSIVSLEPYEMASRLSFFLWASGPDDALLDAAAHDALHTDEQIRAQAQRMVQDDRATRVLWSFHRQWLGLDRILLDEHSVRTPEVDPGWTAATQASAWEETHQFVANVLGQGGTFRDLLTSKRAWVNGEMARVYGVGAPDDPSAWTETVLPDTERAGLLTRAAFLAGFSHRGATSPPVRGNGIQLRLLCELPISPPPGVDLSQPKPADGQGPVTNRMLFETRTSPAACQGCHAGLNGFGFGFELYDAAGHYHTTEQGLPIDASGAIHGTDVDGPFLGAIALSDSLSHSATVYQCAAQQWVRFALGRAASPEEQTLVHTLATSFLSNGGDVRALMIDIATSKTFRLRRVEEH